VSNAERDKWDERYRAGSYEGRTHPSALLEEWLPRLPRGRALDIACGAGRNALHLAAAGYAVDALDISAVALARAAAEAARRGLGVRWICADLEERVDRTLPTEAYDLIVWIRYVNRTLPPKLGARLARGGVLLCEQHLATDAAVVGPANPGFRLAPNELRQMARGLEVLEYREGIVEDPDGRPAALAQLVARAPS
jgi:tellurite methyltransferase